MNTMSPRILWLLGSIALAGVTACSGDDEAATEPDERHVKVRHLTITETDNTAANLPLSRASLREDGGLTASWTAGDALTYWNISQSSPSLSQNVTGTLHASTSAAISQFTGEVVCYEGDKLAVLYPTASVTANGKYSISLSGQDGTLTTLASTFHYVYGVASVQSVTETTATATMAKMKSLLTVCKFSFVDKDGGDAIPIHELTISYGGDDSNTGKYPLSAMVTASDTQADVHAVAAEANGPLTVTTSTSPSEVYVALLPVGSVGSPAEFVFTVTDDGGNTYSGTASATLAEGEYVEATGLRLTKQE